jgi:hypothetical protein
MVKKVNPLKKLTKLAAEKQSKKAMEEEMEELAITGQESEKKAAKWVIEKGKEAQSEQKKEDTAQLEQLESKSRFKFEDYKRYLAGIMYKELFQTKIPEKYSVRPFITDKGVGIAFNTPENRRFVRAFAPVNVPTYDLNACMKLVYTAEDKINALEEEGKQGRDIIKPNGRT